MMSSSNLRQGVVCVGFVLALMACGKENSDKKASAQVNQGFLGKWIQSYQKDEPAPVAKLEITQSKLSVNLNCRISQTEATKVTDSSDFKISLTDDTHFELLEDLSVITPSSKGDCKFELKKGVYELVRASALQYNFVYSKDSSIAGSFVRGETLL